jgi:hypothetical protein
MMCERVTALSSGVIMIVTVDNGKITRCMEWALKYGRMGINIKESGIRIKSTDKVNTYLSMEIVTLGNSVKMRNMVKEL